ncbi:FecR family protein [Dinghuibacter silviterrae]|uniref:FecR family protein n=1 Tax=Dinghuibacter silviterrae TaxID=1539049 RepID=A0A4R8DPD2_9BACT|nr:FecR domain-containing protein [Dinghuibacter silviterrae]TDW99941.1 FecR family protein [Dinghuibacter silviterrae]
MDQNRIWVLMARKLALEASPAELEELEKVIRDHPECQAALDLTQAYWDQHPDTPLTDKEIEEALDKILHTGTHGPVWDEWERTTRRSRVKRKWAAVASVCVAAAGVALWVTRTPKTEKPQPVADTQVQTRPGTRTNLLLPDGTSVWLNAGSNLSYPPAFNGKNREVVLEGEAFFDVAKNPAHPFIVHTVSMTIRVLGTSFDVKAYAGDKTAEATLIKGAIEVTFKNRPEEKILLKPNQKLVVPEEDTANVAVKAGKAPKGTEILPPTIDTHTGVVIETAWTANKLVFQDESFRDLATQMERWYGVAIQFDQQKLGDLRFTGSFEKETIQQALAALQLTADFTYTIHENQITIYER